jgi:3-phosphoinositide dependent protein kinase-1
LNNQGRPYPRVITELPPPSQLDIEWSPVLTRNNERILKLGNLLVTSQSQPHSPNSKGEASTETPKKFSRFFGGGNAAKKRQRLVMITSSARIVIAAAGGEEKKAKMEISLLGNTTWKSYKDAKGLTVWSVDSVCG